MLRRDFSYHLPPELIAQEPRARGLSRMMVVTPHGETPEIAHRSFADFPSQLNAGDVLVINDTRVIPARLFAQPKPGMSRSIELLLTRRVIPSGRSANDAGDAGDQKHCHPERGVGGCRGSEGPTSQTPAAPPVTTRSQDDRTDDDEVWEAWAKPAKRVKAGDVLTFSDALRAHVLSKDEGTVTLRFEGDVTEIDRIGVMPLPPYIARPEPRESDRESYQTVYAAERGAIAAPTAGLHFTPEILEAVAARGVEIVRITLHVGIGTFQPVKVDDIARHTMQTERYDISEPAAAALNRALDTRRTIVAVGTTSVRTLESAIQAGDGRIVPGRAETAIFITPGFRFRVVDRLLTNFHLPESTLLMLVSAFAGMETIRAAYAEAIANRYLFFSYGDCMLLSKGHR
jgi:S-adenosylmethionine:tRNA ribosyltransferase-isomerase